MSVIKILKFGAPWCNPCKVLSQQLLTFDRVPIEHYDAEDSPELATEYKVRNLPTLIFLDESNNVLDRTVGLVTIEQINEIIDKYGTDSSVIQDN